MFSIGAIDNHTFQGLLHDKNNMNESKYDIFSNSLICVKSHFILFFYCQNIYFMYSCCLFYISHKKSVCFLFCWFSMSGVNCWQSHRNRFQTKYLTSFVYSFCFLEHRKPIFFIFVFEMMQSK